MTASERLIDLAGFSGATAGALLLAIGMGATAGAALVNYSGLPTGTAAEHLLADQIVIQEVRYQGGPDSSDAGTLHIERDDEEVVSVVSMTLMVI
jgi:hypothetical protein